MIEDDGTRDSSLLYELDIFRGLEVAVINKYLNKANYQLLPKGEILLSPRTRHYDLYIILTGTLSVHLGSPDSDLIAVVSTGECAGEISLFDEEVPSAYVVAAEDCRLLVLSGKIVWDMIDSCEGFAAKFLHLASSRMRTSNRSVANSRRIQRHYENKVNIDALTRIYNRRWIDQNFPPTFEGLVTDNSLLCLMMIDIDNFKQYNDKHGHLAGDACLRAVSEAIRTSIRPSDLLGRFGGEEFAVLLAGADIGTSANAAERIKANVENMAILDHKSKPLPSVTVSIGVAEGKPNSFYKDTLMTADEALYAAKEQGKNCIFYHE